MKRKVNFAPNCRSISLNGGIKNVNTIKKPISAISIKEAKNLDESEANGHSISANCLTSSKGSGIVSASAIGPLSSAIEGFNNCVTEQLYVVLNY